MSEPGRDRMRGRYARSEARNEEIRRNLEPLEPGERPGAVTVGAVVALALAIANTVALVLGRTVNGDENQGTAIVFSIVLVACAVGMWQARYWAVLGFQALLVIQIVAASALLLTATSWWRAFVALAVLVLSGWLFWKLIRALARLQMPTT